MASTAAPGYFEEVKLGKCVHQVGGALASYPGRVGGAPPMQPGCEVSRAWSFEPQCCSS